MGFGTKLQESSFNEVSSENELDINFGTKLQESSFKVLGF